MRTVISVSLFATMLIACSQFGPSEQEAAVDVNALTDPAEPANGETCLSRAPIDASSFPYAPSVPARGACSAAELETLSRYYGENGPTTDPSLWRAQVSDECGACAFSDASDAAWGPIVRRGDSFEVNRGGCVELASRSEACGTAYQQFQQCLIEACRLECTTAEEFRRCRSDTRVLTTSCKEASGRVKAACGASIVQYESMCRDSRDVYTFEGALRHVCGGVLFPAHVGGPAPDAGPPDAGSPDAGF